MGNWGNLGRIKCGNIYVQLAMCVFWGSRFWPTTGSKAKATEMTTETKHSTANAPNLTFTKHNKVI